MTGRWPAPAALVAGVAGALGAWASLGVVGVAGEGTSARMAVLPPLMWLPFLLAAAILLVAALRLTHAEAAPLYLPLVAWLPWLPGPIPAAWLAWTGPLARFAIIGALVGLGAARWGGSETGDRRSETGDRRPETGDRRPETGTGGSQRRHRETPVRHMTVAFTLAAVLYVAAAWRMAPVLPGGDEPHYLVITQSLLRDGDLRIEDNHRRREYAVYADAELRPHYLKRGIDGEIYSVHAPGLAAVIAPAFALGGYPGVVLFLALACAAGTLTVWLAVWRLTGDSGAAWAAWLTGALTTPFLFQAFTVYPDGPAAVLVAYVACLAWTTPALRAWSLASAGAALALLPWLHSRYALLAAGLAAVLATRLWDDSKATADRARVLTTNVVALFSVPLVGAFAWFAMFKVLYGTWSPAAPYGGATQLSFARIPVGLSGLLIDQQFGVLLNAPVFLIALIAAVAVLRTAPRVALGLALVAVPYLLVVAGFHMWWAGRSSPGRFLVPVLLLLAVPIGPWWVRAGRTARALVCTLLAVSLGISSTLVFVNRGALAYNSRDGYALWVEWAAPAIHLATALPSLFQDSMSTAWARAATWAIACMMGVPAVWWVARRSSRGPLALACGLSIAMVITLGTSLGWQVSGPTLDPGASRLALLQAACGQPGRIVSLWPAAIGNPVASLDLPNASRRAGGGDRPAWSGRDLAPGRYDIITRAGSTGDLAIAVGRPDLVIGRCSPAPESQPSSGCGVRLPAGAVALFVTAAERAPDRSDVELRWRPLDRPTCGPLARRATRTGTVTLFALNEQASVEQGGAWVLGEREARLVLDRDTPHPVLALRLRNGPLPNTVHVASGRWREQVGLAAGETRVLEIPSAAAPSIDVRIRSERGFVPAERDPSSRDYRRLGVWVEGA